MVTKSLKFKLWTYFGFFAALIMVILWLLQIIFLGTYYENMKMRQIEKIGREIMQEYGTEGFDDLVAITSFRNGIIVQVVDEKNQVLAGEALFSDFRGRDPRGRLRDFEVFLQHIHESKDGVTTYKQEDISGMHATAVVFGAELLSANGEKAYLYMSSPLAPVSATQQVLQNQLLIVTVISLLFAFVLSYFIARKLSRPIVKITASASELATGNYDTSFEKGGYTEVDQLADALNHTAGELKKTDELRRDLVANVSHDLRTPLTIIKSYAEMIRDISGDKPEKRAEHTRVIIDETDRLSELVTDLLDLSKLEAGISSLSLSRFDLSEAVQTILNGLHVLTEQEGYQFQLHLEPGCIVEADERKIGQVVYNLISNAVNYTGEDKTVTISVTKKDGFVRFSVADTGKGIAQDDLPRVWERYYRASGKRKRAIHGTGIGLSIVKNILEAHRARYGVMSEVGKGSVFWFELKNTDIP